MKFYDKQYKNIYLVTAILIACFVFMIISTAGVMGNISGKTSADIALKQAKKDCDKKEGELVQLSKNNPLNTACIVDTEKSAKSD
jgi:hypothetical protein